MKTLQETVVRQVFQSEVLLEIQTTRPALAEVIAWADANPVAWQVVTTRRSKAFGVGSCVYIGWAQRSMTPDAVLERVRHLHDLANAKDACCAPDSILVWRVRFSLAHFKDKGFTGGFFQQHDARYPRSCLTLDYTPETLDEVMNKFCAWIDRYYDTARVTIDGKTVRAFDEGRVGSCATRRS